MGIDAGDFANTEWTAARGVDGVTGEHGADAAGERNSRVPEPGSAVRTLAGVGFERGIEQGGLRSDRGGIVRRQPESWTGSAVSGSGVVSVGANGECGGVQRICGRGTGSLDGARGSGAVASVV